MKKEQNEYTKFAKTRRKYNASQIAKGVGLGVALAGFGASMKGAFNNINLSNVGDFASKTGTKALNYYKELIDKCNPNGNVPAYVFLGLAGGFIILMVKGRIKKRRFETKTVSNLVADNENLIAESNELRETAKTLTRRKPQAPVEKKLKNQLLSS